MNLSDYWEKIAPAAVPEKPAEELPREAEPLPLYWPAYVDSIDELLEELDGLRPHWNQSVWDMFEEGKRKYGKRNDEPNPEVP